MTYLSDMILSGPLLPSYKAAREGLRSRLKREANFLHSDICGIFGRRYPASNRVFRNVSNSSVEVIWACV